MVYVQSMQWPHIQQKKLLHNLQLVLHRLRRRCLHLHLHLHQHQCHLPPPLNQVTVETSPTARVTRLAVAFLTSLITVLSTVAVHMRMLFAALTLSTAVPVITLFVMLKKGSASRAREIIWEWLQANDIWLSTSFPGPSCRKEPKRTTVLCSGRGTPLLQCVEEKRTELMIPEAFECRRCSGHYVFSICRHLAILL